MTHLLARICAVGAALSLAACPSAPVEVPCETIDDCQRNELCVDQVCRPACNASADCSDGLVCMRGVCLPGDPATVDAGARDRASGADTGDGADAAATDARLMDARAADVPPHDAACPPGSHDGGDGACVPIGSCSGGYHDGGDGSCVALGDCSDGYHDGGTGICVPTGSCFPGYLLGYPDGDHDGVGVEPATGSCYEALPPDLAAVAGDCDDEDDSVFVESVVHPDRDGDGYTISPDLVCVGAAPPEGYLLSASRPPLTSFRASVARSGGGDGDDWDDMGSVTAPDGDATLCTIDNASRSTSELLLLQDFDLRVPVDAVVQGLRVRVQRQASHGDTGEALGDALAQLLLGGEPQGDNKAKTGVAWTESLTEVSYGGPGDLWGLPLSPIILNDPGFGFALQVTYIEGTLSNIARVDHVWIEVFTDQGSDCDDDDASVWSERVAYVDQDADGFSLGDEQAICVGARLLGIGNQVSLGEDCYDGNAEAYPGATDYHGVDRGDGSFDYDCDGQITKQQITEDSGCECGTVYCATTGRDTFTPGDECGDSTGYMNCRGSICSLGCSLETLHTSVRCR